MALKHSQCSKNITIMWIEKRCVLQHFTMSKLHDFRKSSASMLFVRCGLPINYLHHSAHWLWSSSCVHACVCVCVCVCECVYQLFYFSYQQLYFGFPFIYPLYYIYGNTLVILWKPFQKRKRDKRGETAGGWGAGRRRKAMVHFHLSCQFPPPSQNKSHNSIQLSPLLSQQQFQVLLNPSLPKIKVPYQVYG